MPVPTSSNKIHIQDTHAGTPLDASADLLLNGGVEAPWGKQLDLLHYADAETGGLHVQRFHGIPIVRRPATTPAGEHQLWRRPESNGRRNQRPRRRPPITAVSSSPPCSVRQTTALHGSCRATSSWYNFFANGVILCSEVDELLNCSVEVAVVGLGGELRRDMVAHPAIRSNKADLLDDDGCPSSFSRKS